jgi:transcription factor STE12
MAHMMYSQHHATMAPPQKPETFMLSSEAQQSLPQDAQVALQQVDNCKSSLSSMLILALIIDSKILFNICAC